jgi:hypothetical protein
MADSKYGRLYTHDDVMRITRLLLIKPSMGGQPTTKRAIARLDATNKLRFPADEPLFLLRGQDVRAAGAVRAYQEGCPAAMKAAVGATLQAFKEFALADSDRVKEPS